MHFNLFGIVHYIFKLWLNISDMLSLTVAILFSMVAVAMCCSLNVNNLKLNKKLARCQWLMFEIVATWEVEIGRITV
jgi:hypothetical protein